MPGDLPRMTLTPDDAAALFRATALARPAVDRSSCPDPAHLIAVFTSIAAGVDRLGIASHLASCGSCTREMDALLALFRGRRDWEIAPLAATSRRRRGALARVLARILTAGDRRAGRRTEDPARDAAIEAAPALRPAIGLAVSRMGLVNPPVDVESVATEAARRALESVQAGDSPEHARRAAVRAAFEAAAGAILRSSRGGRHGPLSPRPDLDPALAGRVAEAVARLTDRRRQVVILHLVGFRSPEIATALAFSDDQARNVLLRGLRDLGEILASFGIMLD